ncbi:MAG TPA: glutathionylspermidine synthase family protein [Stellaceae bacterium]|nr:glutathionylspermidine synthase family protein [Stellaceae bacterium]
MERARIAFRPDWQQQAASVGFAHAIIDGKPYWDETTYYRFTLDEIERGLEAPTQTLLGMCYDAVNYIIARPDLMRRLAIPEMAWDYIAKSWRRHDKDLYGRFDLRYDGTAPPKLYEFNADTPTALFEAAVFQWNWLEQNIERGTMANDADQFNSIHEKLIAAFGKLGLGRRTLHLSGLGDDDEDRLTVEYLDDCARQAGLATRLIAIADIGITADGRFTDLEDNIITDLFKLYPWEWLLAETFGAYLPGDTMRMIEPPWKMTLANKGLLAVLWEMYPGHELLLPAYFDGDPRIAELRGATVRKPLLGREGRNIVIGNRPPTAGPYGEEGHVVQALAELPDFVGNRPVIGSWVVAGEACGIGIREEAALVTSDTARFVPHIILG